MAHKVTMPKQTRDVKEGVVLDSEGKILEAQPKGEFGVATGVHPLSQKLFNVLPFVQQIPMLGATLEAYSPRLVASVALERVFVEGLANGFMRFSIQPMLTERYGLSGAMYQRLSSLYTLGGSVNVFFMAIADTFAIFGYTKRWYCVLYLLGGGVFALLYALLPAKESSATPAAAFMFLVALCISNVDNLTVAMYTRRIRRNPASGAALLSWAWGAVIIGNMIAAAVQGPLSDKKLTHVGVYIAAGIQFVLSPLFIFNVFGEQPNRVTCVEDAKANYITRRREERATEKMLAEEKGELAKTEPVDTDDDDLAGFVEPKVNSVLWGAIELNMEVINRNWLMIIHCCVVTAAVVTMAVVTLFGTRWDMLYTCIAILVVVGGTSFVTLPLVVAKTAMFMYFNNALYLRLPGVLDTFYVAKPACLPDGPHFSYTFYTIMNGIVGNACTVIGITLFAGYLNNLTYPVVMGAAAVLVPLVSMFDLVIVKRWNTYIGIPDYAMYIFGDAIIYDTVYFLRYMPVILLMSRVAPRGSEAMVLALLNGIAHLGASFSTTIGYLLMETIWPVTTRGACDYTNAPWLIISGHFVSPLVILPLAFLLMPRSRLGATLDANGNEMEEVMLPRETKNNASSASSRLESNDVDVMSRVSVDEPQRRMRPRQE